MHKYFTALLVITLFAGLGFADDTPVRTDLTPEDLDRVRAITAPTALTAAFVAGLDGRGDTVG